MGEWEEGKASQTSPSFGKNMGFMAKTQILRDYLFIEYFLVLMCNTVSMSLKVLTANVGHAF